MARLMRMPEVAGGGTEAVLHEWSVTEQAGFGAQDVLATVETDKAVVDVEAEQPGVVVKLLVAAGTSVEVGAPIAVLADPGEAVDDVDAVLTALGVTDAAVPTALQVSDAARTAPDPEGAPDQPATPEVPAALVPETVAAAGLTPDGAAPNGNGLPHPPRIFVSPLARRLAREAGLSLTAIAGTGPGGRIVRRDVEAVRRAAPAAAAPAPPAPASSPAGYAD